MLWLAASEPVSGSVRPKQPSALARAQLRQPALLLLLGAPAHDRRAHQRGLHRDDGAHRRAAAADLLDHDRVGQVVEPGAAVLARDDRAEVALVGDLAHQLGVEVVVAVVLARARDDLLVGERRARSRGSAAARRTGRSPCAATLAHELQLGGRDADLHAPAPVELEAVALDAVAEHARRRRSSPTARSATRRRRASPSSSERAGRHALGHGSRTKNASSVVVRRRQRQPRVGARGGCSPPSRWRRCRWRRSGPRRTGARARSPTRRPCSGPTGGVAVPDEDLVEREQLLAVVEPRARPSCARWTRGAAGGDVGAGGRRSPAGGAGRARRRCAGSGLRPITGWPVEVLGDVGDEPVLPEHDDDVLGLEQEAIEVRRAAPSARAPVGGDRRRAPVARAATQRAVAPLDLLERPAALRGGRSAPARACRAREQLAVLGRALDEDRARGDHRRSASPGAARPGRA